MFENPKPARVNPPGSLISGELEARGWSQKDLAEIMGRPVQVVNEIIKGSKQITVATALELAAAFDMKPELWVNLETKYRLFLARESKENTNIVQRSKLFGKAPVAELIKRGWISAKKKIQDLEAEVCAFLEIPSIDKIPQCLVNMRHTQGKEPNDAVLVSWMARAKKLASSQTPAKFDRAKMPSLVEELKPHMRSPAGVAKVKAILLSYGIRFVVVPHLSKTYLDGAVFYLDNDERKNPVVVLTMRYDRIDWFWFTLLHELAHLYKNHYAKNGGVFDGESIEGNDDALEREANDQAGDWLIPSTEYTYYAKKFFITLPDIKALAARVDRHPGIVLGRFQRDGEVEYARHRSLLVRVKSLLEGIIDRP